MAKEIERTLHCAPVQLAPAATAAVRVGLSTFSADQLTDNVEALVQGLTDRFVSKGWRNIRAIHIKGANTMSLPIWLASELWEDEGDIIEHDGQNEAKTKKRKSLGGGDEEEEEEKEEQGKLLEGGMSNKKAKHHGDDDVDAAFTAARKEKLQKQKAKALDDGDQVVVSKKKKKGSVS